jgi:non-ribosomal peptide synthase protein (TIGR01720 family)
VSFNYLGQVDRVVADRGGFALVLESDADESSDESGLAWSQKYLIEINAMIRDERLQVDWSYDERRAGREAIEDLAEKYIKALKRLTAHCQSPEAGGFTPSDFPDMDLNQKELDDLISQISEFID